MPETQMAALIHIRMVNALAEATALVRLEAIMVARDLGLTWEEIGQALDMTRQTAHKRYGHAVDTLRNQPRSRSMVDESSADS